MRANKAHELRNAMNSASEVLTDKQALSAVALYPLWSPDASYVVGERVRYEDKLYKCLQAHDAQDGWNPSDAVSLWAEVLIPDPEVIPDWVQPESTNPYMKGDKVMHNGSAWISDIDNNVWEPSVYGWSPYEIPVESNGEADAVATLFGAITAKAQRQKVLQDEGVLALLDKYNISYEE